jgi:CheY-like chemotaxis protein
MENKKNILLIDQDEYASFLVRDTFLIYGKNKFNVDIINDLSKVDEYLKEKIPDVILIELVFKKDNLPSTEIGLEFLQKLKNNPQLQNTKIFVFSNYSDLKNQALEKGADDFIVKGSHFPKELYNYISGKLDGSPANFK